MSSFRRRLMMAQGGGGSLNPDGVYIQSIDGKFYTYDEWNFPNEQANGVAVISSEHPDGGFVIAKEESTSSLYFTPKGNYTIINGLQILPSLSLAINDFSGFESTNIIINDLGIGSDYAAGYCYNYKFNNNNNGYLGSAGEWNLLYTFIEEINKLFSKIGCIGISKYYYTSSLKEEYLSWTLSANNYFDSDMYFDEKSYIRPFCKLK